MKFLLRVQRPHHHDRAFTYAAVEVTEFLLDMIQLSQQHGQELDIMGGGYCRQLAPEFYVLLPIAFEAAGLMEGDLDQPFRLPEHFIVPHGDASWDSSVVLRIRRDHVYWVISAKCSIGYQETQKIHSRDLCPREEDNESGGSES